MKVSFAPLEPDAAAFLSAETGVDFTQINFDQDVWLCITSRDEETGMVALVIVVEFKADWDAHLSLAIRNPRAATRRLMKAGYKSVFAHAKRLTALIDVNNPVAHQKAIRMGFQYEGYVRLGIAGERDALLFGMLPYDCPWLDEWHQHRRQSPIPFSAEAVPFGAPVH